MVPCLTSSIKDSPFYDITYQISNTVEINLVRGLVGEDDEIAFQTFSILTYDGSRQYGEGMEILESQEFNRRHLVREASLRVAVPIFEILRRENKRAYNQLVPLKENLAHQGLANSIFGRNGYGSCVNDNQEFCGMMNFLTIDGDSFEKIISCMGMDFLYANIFSKRMNVKSGNKINQVLGVPKSIIPRIREEFPNEMDSFQTICSVLNGNDAIYLLDFLDTVFVRKATGDLSDKNMRKTIRTIGEIEGFRKTAMPTLLTYLFRQTYYSSFMYEGSVAYAGDGQFLSISRFLDTCVILRDTLSMYKKMTGLTPDDLPTDLFYEHQVLAENNKSISDKDQENSFNEAVADYSRLNATDGNFEIRAPKNVQELVVEGTMLRHCVASYKDRIANRQSIVMFVRKKTQPEEPFVTVEYEPGLGVVQVKEKFDKDASDSAVLRFVRTWEKGVKL